MKSQAIERKTVTVTVNKEQGLYVIPESGGGYSCLGFDVCLERIARLAGDLGAPTPKFRRGSLKAYRFLESLQSLAFKRHKETGWKGTCELSPQLRGLEGKRVEVVTKYGETRRFQVGRSTGWLPIHLEIFRRTSTGGSAAEREYKSVRVVS